MSSYLTITLATSCLIGIGLMGFFAIRAIRPRRGYK